MKKLLNSMKPLLFVLVLALCISMIACDSMPTKKSNGTKEESFSSKNFYAVSAFASANYLTNSDNATSEVNNAPKMSASGTTSSSNDAKSSRPSGITDATVTEIASCVETFDSILNNGMVSQTIADNTDETYKDYSFVMSIAIGKDTVKMYYNELYTATNKEVDDDGDVEIEQSTTLKGILVFGEKVYDVDGRSEVEKDGDETEFSIEFITRKSNGNYVKMSYETENERNESEVSYKYAIYENGREVSETEFEIETKNGKTEIKFEVESNDNQEIELKVYKQDNNKFRVKREVGNDDTFITVEKGANGYVFTYSNGYTETIGF